MAGRARVAVIDCGNVSRGHIQAGPIEIGEIVGLYDLLRSFCEERKKPYGLAGSASPGGQH